MALLTVLFAAFAIRLLTASTPDTLIIADLFLINKSNNLESTSLAASKINFRFSGVVRSFDR